MREEDAQHLHDLLAETYDEKTVERIERGFSAERPVTLRANALKTDVGSLASLLADHGIAVERAPWYEDALVVADGTRERALQALPAYEEGLFYLQSLSSMLPPLVLDPKAGETILDMTAAPGGKTTQMAALSGNAALITACEKNAIRADRLAFNLDRQGAARVSVMRADARKLDDFFSFDKVLLDAPCSGSGTISSRNRERAGFSAELVERSARAQAALLDKALSVLSPGGTMVYSTCSVLKRENERIVERAIARKQGAVEVVPVEGAFLEYAPLLPTDIEGTVCLCPDDRFEGFFIAKLRRTR